MAYHVIIESPAIREARIRASSQASDETQPFYDFRSQTMALKVVRLPINLLLYRMENFRTITEQRAYIAREGKPPDFFLAGQENESVQQIQHDILAGLARRGRADSVVPIITVLKTQRQRDPLLITHRGIIVNGNRRLAAMRELLDEDRAAYGEFDYVKCMVLPEDVTPDEIVDIEAISQGQPETKLDYDWISDGLLLQKLRNLGRSEEDLAKRLNRRPRDIRDSLAALAEAGIYLRDWAQDEGNYALVRDDARQLFRDLPDLLSGKDPALADASRVIAWNLFENRERLNERLYVFNGVFGKHAADVLDRLATDLGIPLAEDAPEGDDEFVVDVGGGGTSYQPVIDAFRDPERKDEAIDQLIEVSRGVVEQERSRRSGNAALRAIAAANARLTEVDLGRAERSDYRSIERQLEQIAKRVTELQEVLSRLQAAGQGNPAAGT